MPFRLFSAQFRPYTAQAYQRQPAAGRSTAMGAFSSAPRRIRSYAIELDTIVLPTPIPTGDTTTIDPIPPMVQDPIKFYAA